MRSMQETYDAAIGGHKGLLHVGCGGPEGKGGEGRGDGGDGGDGGDEEPDAESLRRAIDGTYESLRSLERQLERVVGERKRPS